MGVSLYLYMICRYVCFVITELYRGNGSLSLITCRRSQQMLLCVSMQLFYLSFNQTHPHQRCPYGLYCHLCLCVRRGWWIYVVTEVICNLGHSQLLLLLFQTCFLSDIVDQTGQLCQWGPTPHLVGPLPCTSQPKSYWLMLADISLILASGVFDR